MKKVEQYETPNGVIVPGTTTVTNTMAKEALYYWYGKHGNQECQRIIKESQDFGSRIHALIEARVKGQEPEMDAEEKKVMKNFDVWASENVKDFVWFEKDFALDEHPFTFTVGEKKYTMPLYGYGGTADLCYIDKAGARILGDIKTGNQWPEHKIQVAAYEYGLKMQYGEEFDDKRIIALDKKTRIWEGLRANTIGHMEVFASLRMAYKWKKGN